MKKQRLEDELEDIIDDMISQGLTLEEIISEVVVLNTLYRRLMIRLSQNESTLTRGYVH
jgi:hypothetical protein